MPCGSKIGWADFTENGGYDPGTGILLEIFEEGI
jgi:hypothetical protein